MSRNISRENSVLRRRGEIRSTSVTARPKSRCREKRFEIYVQKYANLEKADWH